MPPTRLHLHPLEDPAHDLSTSPPEVREMRQDLAYALRMLRRLHDWSQQDLATASGVNAATIAKIEQQRTSPMVDTLVRLLVAGGHTILIEPLPPAPQPPRVPQPEDLPRPPPVPQIPPRAYRYPDQCFCADLGGLAHRPHDPLLP